MTKNGNRSYLDRREQAEREAATKATCADARRVHEELARLYAGAGRRADRLAAEPADPKAIIITKIG